jgi:hypothetical protein
VCSGCLGEVARDEGVELAMGGNNAEDGGRTDVRVSLGAGGALSGLCTGAKDSLGSSSKRLAWRCYVCGRYRAGAECSVRRDEFGESKELSVGEVGGKGVASDGAFVESDDLTTSVYGSGRESVDGG